MLEEIRFKDSNFNVLIKIIVNDPKVNDRCDIWVSYNSDEHVDVSTDDLSAKKIHDVSKYFSWKFNLTREEKKVLTSVLKYGIKKYKSYGPNKF